MAFGSSNTAVGIAFQGKDELSPVVRGIRSSMDGFKKDAATGFGLGAGISVFNAAKNVLGDVIGVFGNAVTAAMEEEAAIAQLSQAIAANDASWDGNIGKVEEVIAKRQDLAYSDDEQRASLQRLVATTGDVTDALDLQATAMDFARLRGIDLSSASDILGKVYAGNVGILGRYGIQLEKGTSATEALAEVQRRARGQAEAFAETTSGSVLRAQIQLSNALEEVGKALLPVVASLADFAADVIPDVMAGLHDLGRALNQTAAYEEDLQEAAERVATAMGIDTEVLKEVVVERHRVTVAMKEQARVSDVLKKSADGLTKVQEDSIPVMVGIAQRMTNEGQTRSAIIKELAYQTKLTYEQADALAGEEMNIEKVIRALLRGAQSADVSATATAGLTDAEIEATAAGELFLLNQARMLGIMGRIPQGSQEASTAIAGLGRATADAAASVKGGTDNILNGIRALSPSIKETIDNGREGVREAMANLRWAMENPFADEKFAKWLKEQADQAMKMLAQAIKEGRPAAVAEAAATRIAILEELNAIDPGAGTQEAWRQRRREMDTNAGGGHVPAGGVTLVGERGPEVLVMGSSGGQIVPNHKLGSGGGGGDVYLDGYLVGRILDERLGRQYGTASRVSAYRRSS